MFFKQIVEGLTHSFFRRGKAGTLCIGGVAHQGKHALSAELGETLQIDRIAEDGGIVHLEVTGMDHDASGRSDRQRCRIHDTVVGADELYAKLSQIDALSELHYLSLGGFQKLMLAELILDNSHSQSGRVDGNIDFL